jgi:hypothetical protein
MANNVEEYLKKLPDKEKAPLIFCDSEGNPSNLGIKKQIKKKEIDSTVKLVTCILRHKEHYYSKNTVTKEVETSTGRHRSSLDIWRHVIFYKPEITLMEVMNILWNTREELRYQMCNMLKKRVFDLESERGVRLHQDSNNYDEYGLSFGDWGNLCTN